MKIPAMIKVTSSNISRIGYSEKKKELFVKFNNGSLYEYYNVPKVLFTDMIRAKSKGKFFNRKIKNRFSYQRIFKECL